MGARPHTNQPIGNRRRAIVPDGFVEAPAMGFLRAIPDGSDVEIVVVRSTGDAAGRLQGTLRSFRLHDKHTRERVSIINHAPTTPGALHQIRHLVAVRVADPRQDPPRRRTIDRPVSLQEERLPMTKYEASGGTSALFDVGGWPVRAEAHLGSFALAWPARTSLGELFSWLGQQRADGEVLLGGSTEPPHEYPWPEARSVIDSPDVERFSFARIDLPGLVLTWTPGLRQLPSRPGKPGVAEVGAGAERFDPQLMIRLLDATAVQPVAAQAQAVIREADRLLVDIPRGAVRLAA